jgi:TonB family protein
MTRAVAAVSFVLAIGAATQASAQDALGAARELYAAAAYEDALDVLNRASQSSAEIGGGDADVLKAFCLLALRREEEARLTIHGVITERPTYMPAEEEASPRIRGAFREVRQRLLPDVARQLYQSAKSDYENNAHTSAAAKFTDLLRVLEDPDLARDATLKDLRMLTEGFRSVSAAAVKAVATAANTAVGTATEPAPPPRAVGTSGDASESSGVVLAPQLVVPPVAITQQLPTWRGDFGNVRIDHTGAVDLVIDEQGHVESVSLRNSVHPLYDAELLRVAKTWTYQPAHRGGQPIKFQKTLIVRLTGR